MPYKYLVECVCDKLAATRVYSGKGADYSKEKPLQHFRKWSRIEDINPKTVLFIETVFTDLQVIGEDGILNKKYMTDTYNKIHLDR